MKLSVEDIEVTYCKTCQHIIGDNTSCNHNKTTIPLADLLNKVVMWNKD